jgi:hypothetical protein
MFGFIVVLFGWFVLCYVAAELESFINARSSSLIKVADIPSRNALTNLTDGQFVFVRDTGTGSHEYALYMECK